MTKPIALIFLVAGLILLIVGLNLADSFQDAFSRLFSGHLSDRTVWLVVGGAVCLVVGLFGCFQRRHA
jgi:hypothetical protein